MSDFTPEVVAQNLRQRADKMDALFRIHEANWFRKGADTVESQIKDIESLRAENKKLKHALNMVVVTSETVKATTCVVAMAQTARRALKESDNE